MTISEQPVTHEDLQVARMTVTAAAERLVDAWHNGTNISMTYLERDLARSVAEYQETWAGWLNKITSR